MSEILACENLRKSFRDGTHVLEVLDDVSLRVRRGDIVGIAGNSGSGKTTLLNILGLLDTPSAGRVMYDDAGRYQPSAA